MIILGFDSSSYITGWAVIDCGPTGALTLAKSGRIVLKHGTLIGERLSLIEQTFTDLIRMIKPDSVVYEEPYVWRLNAAKPLYKVVGIIEKICFQETGKEARNINVSTIRKVLSCSSKQGVKDIVEQTFHIRLTDEQLDISDAIAVAMAAPLVPDKKEKRKRRPKCEGTAPTTDATVVDG